MRFTVDRGELATALALTAKALPRIGATGLTIELDDNVVELRTTNYEITITGYAEVTNATSGIVVVPGAVLAAWVTAERPRRGNDTITVVVEHDVLTCKGQRTLSVPVMRVEPLVTTESDRHHAAQPMGMVSRAQLLNALKRVAGCAGRDAALPIFAGVNLVATGSRLQLTATDRYKIGRVAIPATNLGNWTAIVPAAQVVSLVGALTGDEIGIIYAGGTISLGGSNGRVAMTCVAGDYPNVSGIIESSSPNETKVFAGELRAEVAALTQVVGTMTTAKAHRIKLRGDDVALIASPVDRADVPPISGTLLSTPIEINGDPIEIDIDPAHLLPVLDVVATSGAVCLGHSTAPGAIARVRPLVITPELDEDGGIEAIACLQPLR